MADQRPTEVKPGQRWQDDSAGIVTVLAVHTDRNQSWAWCKRRRRNPFTASVDQMLRGDYGWTLVSDANGGTNG